ncbi:hypothetical protein VN24_23775 [Paenibacillus beijingensis]|uniref:Leucine-binding protein domain-containing protein n=2 Tax=Paenibacillus beijingensis TaxID=1126833 RepID=A0A0D5NSU4_9BACL|nr:hypothetical protein VN24_23775 [Paenibacillus beijingensis]
MTACGGKETSGAQETSGGKETSGSSAAAESKETKEVSLGLSAPLTGNSAQYGESFRNAMKMAIDEFNAKGGAVKVNLVEMDSKNDPKESANIAQKLVDNDNIVAVVGDFSSTTSMAASPIYQRSGLVQLSPTSSHPDFTSTGDYIFRNVPTQKIEGAFVADYAKELGYKKSAVIYIQNDWGIAAKENFEAKFKEAGGEVSNSLNFNPDTKDFNNILIKIRESGPDVIYLGAPYTESALIAQQSKKLGIKAGFIGTSILYSDQYIQLGGKDVEGTHLSSYFFPADPRPEVQKFVEAYKKTYSKDPDMFAALTYDSANMLLSIIEKGETSRKGIRDALAAMKDFPGITGKTSFNDIRNVEKDLAKLDVKDGQFTLYKKE